MRSKYQVSLIHRTESDQQAYSYIIRKQSAPQDLLIHYVRYQGKSILTTEDMSLLMNKWKY